MPVTCSLHALMPAVVGALRRVTSALVLRWLLFTAIFSLAAVPPLVGALAGSTAWGARPQLLNMVFTGVLVVGLGAYRQGRLNPLLLPPFIWLWANLHSGFLVGVIIAGLFLIGEWFDARRSPATGMPAPRQAGFGWAIVAGVVLSMVNPSGVQTLLFPLGTLTSPLIQNNIQEC